MAGEGEDVFPEQRLRPTVEDYLRALAYLGFISWGVLFLIWPPVAYADTVDLTTRLAWVGTCILGASAAFLGAVLRIDLKLELPGLSFMLIGPLFYGAAQAWYIMNPPVTSTDPTARNALLVYAFLPLLLTLPRMYALYSEAQKSSALRKEMKKDLPKEEL